MHLTQPHANLRAGTVLGGIWQLCHLWRIIWVCCLLSQVLWVLQDFDLCLFVWDKCPSQWRAEEVLVPLLWQGNHAGVCLCKSSRCWLQEQLQHPGAEAAG